MPIWEQGKTRKPAVSGSFYPSEATTLRSDIATAEASLPALAPSQKNIHGCILPHAGYVYSLGCAVETFRATRGRGYSKVVLIGPTHYVGFRGIAMASFSNWSTPLGVLSTATDLFECLESEHNPLIKINDDIHLPEHSLEVELPLIQYFLGEPTILPLVVGVASPTDIVSLGNTLAKLDAPDVLWVISSDFTHYGTQFHYTPLGFCIDSKQLNSLDRKAAKLIGDRNLVGFDSFLQETRATICGAFVISIYLAMLDQLDPERSIRGRIVAIADSGQVGGDYSSVVDYVGMLFEKS